MTYLAQPLRLKPDDMVRYILNLPKAELSWSPRGATWHNAAEPDLKQWSAYSEAIKEAWGRNYDFYCKTTQHWHSGPHFIGTPDGWAFVLCDPLADGVHASCFNHDHLGFETVGNFAEGADDPLTGAGLAAMSSTANAIAASCAWLGLDPDAALNFHRECKADGHPCPGARVTDDWAKGLVKARLAEIRAAPLTGPIPPPPPAATLAPTITLPAWPAPTNAFFANARTLFAAWLAKGVSVPFALAMVTQAEFESWFEPQAIGDNDQAHNLYQWHWAPRGAAILANTSIDVRSERDFGKVVDAAWWELNHTEIAAREAIAAAKTAADASRAACTLFEGAGAPEAADRRSLGAERWSVWFATHQEA